MTASPQKNQPDFFTQIALTEIRDSSLKTPREPLPFDKRAAVLTPTEQAPIPTVQSMQTKEELDKALAEMRKSYAPYLRSCAPDLPAINQRTYIKEFLLNGEQPITIPHFDGPMGNEVKTYTSQFSLEAFDGKAVYICFRGADYIAKVYVNDICVGIHEGFFSPFEFEITSAAKVGNNTLKVVLENDFNFRGGTVEGEAGLIKGLPEIEGDKLYAETGLGFDDPNMGWLHCPPGMGIYADVFVEVRNTMHITDLYVRPLLDEQAAELWLEVENALHTKEDLTFRLSLYGKNFEETVFDFETIQKLGMPVTIGSNIYGEDYAYHSISMKHEETIRYPVFGVVENSVYYDYIKTTEDADTGEMIQEVTTLSGSIVDQVNKFNASASESLSEDAAEDVVKVEILESAEASATCGAAHACVSELVVTRLLVGVAQYAVCLGSFFKFLLGIFLFGLALVFLLVGVVLNCLFTVCLFYGIGCGVFLHAKHFVVVSFCHVCVIRLLPLWRDVLLCRLIYIRSVCSRVPFL